MAQPNAVKSRQGGVGRFLTYFCERPLWMTPLRALRVLLFWLHCALSCAVYCNRPCLSVCLWVRLTTDSAQCLRRL